MPSVDLNNDDGSLQGALGGTAKAANMASTGNANVQSHNRYLTGITDSVIKSATWGADEKVKAVRFKLVAGATAVVGDVVRVVFNATPIDNIADTVQAANWLATPVAAVDTDIESFDLVMGGQGVVNGYIPEWSDWFHFADDIQRVDLLAETAGRTYDVKLEVR